MSYPGHVEVTGLVGSATVRLFLHVDEECTEFPALPLNPDQVVDLTMQLRLVAAGLPGPSDDPIPFVPVDPPTQEQP